jgi:hypothetical protein
MSVLRHRKRGDGGGGGAAAAKKIGRGEVSESAARRDTRLERSVGQLERIRSLREGEGEGGGEEEGGEGKTPKSPRLRKRGSHRGNGVSPVVETGGGGGGALEGRNADLVTAGGGAGGGDDGGEEEDEDRDRVFSPAQQLQLQRSTTASGNLGTRTLGGGGGFLHRRVSSMGMMGGPHGAGSVDGSVAGASTATTTRKKRFGTLRKIFGIHD